MDDERKHGGSSDILVVDDNPVNLKILGHLLTQNGYCVRSAADGLSALQAVSAAPPDLILLDIMMPDMDGYQVCEHLKSDQRTRDIPIIFISALSEASDKVRAFRVGGVDYVTKPFQFEEVLARVRNQLTLQRQRREIALLHERDRQRLEELQTEIRERQRAEAQYRALVKHLPETAVVLFDSNLRFVLVEGMPLPGPACTKDQIEGRTLWEALPPHLAEQFAPMYQAALAGVEQRFEASCDGRFYEAHLVPVHTLDGSISYGMLVVRDITVRKQTEKQALDLAVEKEKVRLLADFIQNTSHDLRTPLTVIGTSAYLLRRLSEPDKQREHLDRIETQLFHMDKLIDELHTMSNLDSQVTFNISMVDVNHLVQSVNKPLCGQLDEKRLRLVWELQPDLPPMMADADKLQRALYHLLENAVIYTNPGGTITVRTRNCDLHVEIEYQDTGIGIEPEHLPYIFDRFYKTNTARTSNKSGAGLGLAIVRRVVELHSGRVEVQSTLGQGSLFRVILPLTQRLEPLRPA